MTVACGAAEVSEGIPMWRFSYFGPADDAVRALRADRECPASDRLVAAGSSAVVVTSAADAG